jgi:hypothetical protein
MYLTENEKQALLKLYKSDCSEVVINGLSIGTVKSLKDKGFIQAAINGNEIIDIRLWPKTKDYIKDNLL